MSWRLPKTDLETIFLTWKKWSLRTSGFHNRNLIDIHSLINPKKGGGFVFPKRYFTERLKPCFFVTFNIIISHIFPKNVIEFPQVIQKIWRVSPLILTHFIFFFIFWHFLFTKKLMASAYNRWCQHFFTFGQL